MEQTEKQVLEWAKQRGLLFPENAKNQFLKTISECGEIADALLKDDQEAIKDGIGDVLVTLTLLANVRGLNLKECYQRAYNEIKNRKGKTINGNFIKDGLQ